MLVYAALNKTIKAKGESIYETRKWTAKEILVALCLRALLAFYFRCVWEMDYNEGSRVSMKPTDLLFFGGAWSSGLGHGL